MCIPCGPKWAGAPGRVAFSTLADVCSSCSPEHAQKKYPDNAAAMQKLFSYTDSNIDHTMKWMVNDLYTRDLCLVRIAAEGENLAAWKKYYNQARKDR